MNKYDLVIIGAGASGLSAGISALKSGIKDVLIYLLIMDLVNII